MSGASRISKGSQNRGAHNHYQGKQNDAMSVTSSQPARTEVYSELDEEDEWTAIQKFNTLLHYEEQKQSHLRDKERKRLIKQELDKQLGEKNNKKVRERKENEMYEELQQQHLKLLEEREKEKQ